MANVLKGSDETMVYLLSSKLLVVYLLVRDLLCRKRQREPSARTVDNINGWTFPTNTSTHCKEQTPLSYSNYDIQWMVDINRLYSKPRIYEGRYSDIRGVGDSE